MEKAILQVISGNLELIELYQNDYIFKECITRAIDNNMSVENALIFALIQGYKLKDKYYETIIETNINSYNSHF